jgi:predicted extracellular nuclease
MFPSILRRTPHLLVAIVVGAAILVPTLAHAISADVVISQVYGGGGNSGATLKNDFIELHNRGAAAVDLTGWSVQYASAAGTTWTLTALSGSIAPGGYYLVQEAQGTGGTTNLPTPDATGTIAMSATAAKVALVNDAVALSGTCPSGSSIVDLVGYGTTASCFEGTATPTLSNTTAAIRNNGGCTETDDNGADFTELAPSPRNSASAAFSCQVTLALAANPVAGGTVAAAPSQASYLIGTPVTITATAAQGYFFVEWAGDASGTLNPLPIVMDADKSITALFSPLPGNDQIVVSQLYGGGGNAGATYKRDFVELYNRGANPVDVTGWTIQYSASDGSGEWTMTTLLGVIPRGHYYLVAEDQGVGGSLDLPTPDIIHDIPVHAVAGKVAVVSNNTPLNGACPTGSGIVDMLGYGAANCSENAVSSALDNVTAAFRIDGGCRDTDDNASDFVSGAPAPRNSATAANYCAFWLDVDDAPTAGLELAPVVPNPTRMGSRITFSLPAAGKVRVDVLDIQGRAVATVADGDYTAGIHQVRWSGVTSSGIARSGVYFIRLQAPQGTRVRRLSVTQ